MDRENIAIKGLNKNFKKSSYTTIAGNPACVEVSRPNGDIILVRDTKEKGKGPNLSFNAREWNAFIKGVKDGEFDLLQDE